MKRTITAEVIAVPGDKVWVSNYRKSDEWEAGEVRNTEINVNNSGEPRVSYHVWVERTPKHPRGKYGYYLSVSRDRIQEIDE